VLSFLGAKSEVISRDISETGNKWKVQEWNGSYFQLITSAGLFDDHSYV
jgi:hypothetical protein